MLRRILFLSCFAVALSTTVGAAPVSAATCTAALVADLPPPSAGGGDFAVVLSNVPVPASVVGAYLAGMSAAFSGIQAALPPGSQVAIVNVCF